MTQAYLRAEALVATDSMTTVLCSPVLFGVASKDHDAGCSAAAPDVGGWTPAGQRLHHGAAQNGTAGPPSKPDSQHGNPLFGQVCRLALMLSPSSTFCIFTMLRAVLSRAAYAEDLQSKTAWP